jgi:hypothetical protein
MGDSLHAVKDEGKIPVGHGPLVSRSVRRTIPQVPLQDFNPAPTSDAKAAENGTRRGSGRGLWGGNLNVGNDIGIAALLIAGVDGRSGVTVRTAVGDDGIGVEGRRVQVGVDLGKRTA